VWACIPVVVRQAKYGRETGQQEAVSLCGKSGSAGVCNVLRQGRDSKGTTSEPRTNKPKIQVTRTRSASDGTACTVAPKEGPVRQMNRKPSKCNATGKKWNRFRSQYRTSRPECDIRSVHAVPWNAPDIPCSPCIPVFCQQQKEWCVRERTYKMA